MKRQIQESEKLIIQQRQQWLPLPLTNFCSGVLTMEAFHAASFHSQDYVVYTVLSSHPDELFTTLPYAQYL